MKRILIFFWLLLLFSCVQNKSGSQNDNNESILSDAESEKNLKSQLKDYGVAFLGGNAEKLIFYMYPDAINFFHQKYPNDEHYDIQHYKDTIIKKSKEFNKEIRGQKLYCEYRIGNITKKVNYKASMLCLVQTFLNVKDGHDTNSIPGEVVAVSNNNGRTWQFVENNNDISGILQLKFPKDIVDKLLNKGTIQQTNTIRQSTPAQTPKDYISQQEKAKADAFAAEQKATPQGMPNTGYITRGKK